MKAKEKTTCKVCGKGPFFARGIMSHVRRSHGVEAKRTYHTLPEIAKPLAITVSSHELGFCPDCGLDVKVFTGAIKHTVTFCPQCGVNLKKVEEVLRVVA